MADFKLQAAQQRFKVLAAAKQQVAANISRYEAENDLDSASDDIQAYSNLESRNKISRLLSALPSCECSPPVRADIRFRVHGDEPGADVGTSRVG